MTSIRILAKRLRTWVRSAVAHILKQVTQPDPDHEMRLIEGYLRVQHLRRIEEQRFRSLWHRRFL